MFMMANNVITLNVGGTNFTTTVATLTQGHWLQFWLENHFIFVEKYANMRGINMYPIMRQFSSRNSIAF